MDTFPDLGSLSDQELKDLIQQLTDEEIEISYRRRILHGKIDILRAEFVNRLRRKHEGGEEVITGEDVPAADRHPRRPRPGRRRTRAGRRGPAWLSTARSAASSTPKAPTTARSAARSWAPGGRGRELDDRDLPRSTRPASSCPSTLDEVVAREGAALVIRAGGGRVGESFALDGDRMSIGRRPDADIFLDDVTVSRDHALLVTPRRRLLPRRPGSLNGTYVNRRRIESHRLEDGDELQVGKFKLTFLDP